MVPFEHARTGTRLVFTTRPRGHISGLHHYGTRVGEIVRITPDALHLHCEDRTRARILRAEYPTRVLDDLDPLQAPPGSALEHLTAALQRRIHALEASPRHWDLAQVMEEPVWALRQGNAVAASGSYVRAVQGLRDLYQRGDRNRAATVAADVMEERIRSRAGDLAWHNLSTFLNAGAPQPG